MYVLSKSLINVSSLLPQVFCTKPEKSYHPLYVFLWSKYLFLYYIIALTDCSLLLYVKLHRLQRTPQWLRGLPGDAHWIIESTTPIKGRLSLTLL